MDRNSILVTRSSMPTLDEYVDEIRPLWDSHWLTNAGLEHRKLESELQSYLNVPHTSLFVNGHSALEGAIEAMDITGEAITTPFSFASTTHALVRRGVKPVFCDIRKDDCTIDVSKIEALITPRTTAIVPVHVYGNVCDVDAIQRIARKHGLKVIYDGAHSFGVKKNGQSTATFGDATMFSFHATKVFNTIEGGAVCYHDDFLTPELARVRNFGITGPETVLSVGGNAKMNEFCAAMGICNLRHIDAEIAKRKQVADQYRKNLSGTDGIVLTPEPGTGSQRDVQSNYSYMPVLFDESKLNGVTRDDIYNILMKHDIYSRKYFYPLITDFDCYKDQFDSSRTPVAQWVSKRILCLPMFADLPLDDVDRISDIILTAIGR